MGPCMPGVQASSRAQTRAGGRQPSRTVLGWRTTEPTQNQRAEAGLLQLTRRFMQSPTPTATPQALSSPEARASCALPPPITLGKRL